MTGKVLFFNRIRGYGKIKSDSDMMDYFFHVSDLFYPEYKDIINCETKVEFNPSFDEERMDLHAQRIRVVISPVEEIFFLRKIINDLRKEKEELEGELR